MMARSYNIQKLGKLSYRRKLSRVDKRIILLDIKIHKALKRGFFSIYKDIVNGKKCGCELNVAIDFS